jgi:hypothetical protein
MSNLVTNGNMELDSDWANRNTPTTNERSIEQVHGGTYSRKVVPNAQFDGIKSAIKDISVVKDIIYLVEVWVYGDASGDMWQARSENGTAPNYFFFGSTVFLAAWTLKKSTFVAHTTETFRFSFYSATGVPAGLAYIDDISIRQIGVKGVGGMGMGMGMTLR